VNAPLGKEGTGGRERRGGKGEEEYYPKENPGNRLVPPNFIYLPSHNDHTSD